MPERKKRFTPEFRDEAVRLAQTGGRSRREVAADLGIGPSTLRSWIDGRRDRHMNEPPSAMLETFFKMLKTELVWRTVFQTRAEASKALARYIDGFYNPVRRHLGLDFIGPAQFERQATANQTALH